MIVYLLFLLMVVIAIIWSLWKAPVDTDLWREEDEDSL